MKQYKPPYDAWNVTAKDYPIKGNFEEKIQFLLKYGILAPSTFNSQPWICKIGKQSLNIYLNTLRVLKLSDKTGRFACISMGCFIQNILIAARHFNWKVDPKFLFQKQQNLMLIMSLNLQENKEKKDKSDLFDMLKKRQTNRSFFLKDKIDNFLIKSLDIEANRSGLKLVIFSKSNLEELINISKIGDEDIWNDLEFRKEHVKWVRNNLTKKYDGMPGFGVGVKTIPSFFAKPIILSPIFPKFQLKKNIRSLKSTQYFGVLCGEDTNSSWVRVGMTYENMALMLASKKLVAAPLGQFIESDRARSGLIKLTQKYTTLKPQIFFRIGCPSSSVHPAPRLPVEKILR